MTYTGIIAVELSDYGGEGTVELCAPSLRKVREAQNIVGKYSKFNTRTGENIVDGSHISDIQIIGLMSYIRKAPFDTTLDGFLDYGDILDEKTPGSATRLMNDLISVARGIDNGDVSPFVPSPEAETEISG